MPVCGHCERSQPLLWATLSIWCLLLFINPESVTVAQKPETAAEERRAEGVAAGEHHVEFVFLC